MTVNRLTYALAVGAALATAACGEGLTLPPEGEAANITVIHGDSPPQNGLVRSQLRDSVVVEVTDVLGRVVPGATVNFTFPDGDAEAAPATVTTNSSGIAWTKVTLGAQVGPVAGVAEVPVAAGITPVRTTFTAMALPGDANGIAMVSGNGQSAPVGTALPAPLVVQVSDQEGNPIPRVTVNWSAAGGGEVSALTTVTGDNGQTSVTRTLGPTAGEQTTLAEAQGLAGSPIVFTHTATAGTANRIIKVSGDGQSAPAGGQLSAPLVVRVLDANDNPIPNEPVTWVPASGGGSVNPPNSTTNAQGEASTQWTLGPSAGTNTVTAVASRAGTSTVAFTATATAGTPSSTNSTVSASPETITAGSGSSTITVTVRDASDNPVAGVSVTINSTGDGNTTTPASASTGGNGVATFTFSSTVPGTKTIAATAGGVELNQRPTITVQKASSTVEITDDAPEPSTVNQSVKVEFTVTGGGPTPTGDVRITVSGGPETCTGTLSNGSGFCDVVLTEPGPPGNRRRTITAAYSGDANYSPDTGTKTHRVLPVPPIAEFTFSCTGLTCQFTDQSTDDGTIASWSWNFGDPASGPLNSSNEKNPSHTFSGAATYTVTLTVTDDDAVTDNVTHTVTVSPPTGNQPPVAGDDAYSTPVGVPFARGASDGVLFNDTDEDPATLITRMLTNVPPDKGQVTEFDTDGSFTFSPDGPNGSAVAGDVLTFTYEVMDSEGATDTATVTVTITP